MGLEISWQALGKGAAQAPITDKPPGMEEDLVQTVPPRDLCRGEGL